MKFIFIELYLKEIKKRGQREDYKIFKIMNSISGFLQKFLNLEKDTTQNYC